MRRGVLLPSLGLDLGRPDGIKSIRRSNEKGVFRTRSRKEKEKSSSAKLTFHGDSNKSFFFVFRSASNTFGNFPLSIFLHRNAAFSKWNGVSEFESVAMPLQDSRFPRPNATLISKSRRSKTVCEEVNSNGRAQKFPSSK